MCKALKDVTVPAENEIISQDLQHLNVLFLVHEGATEPDATEFPDPDTVKKSRNHLTTNLNSKFQKAMGVFPVCTKLDAAATRYCKLIESDKTHQSTLDALADADRLPLFGVKLERCCRQTAAASTSGGAATAGQQREGRCRRRRASA